MTSQARRTRRPANFTHYNALGSATTAGSNGDISPPQESLYYPWGQVWDDYEFVPINEGDFAGMKSAGSNYWSVCNRMPWATTPCRGYNTSYGRWMSPDPDAGDTSSPQSLNRYSYANNNPVNWVDPEGLLAYAPTWTRPHQQKKQRGCGSGPGDNCTPEKRRFFDWLNDPLTKMASDLTTDKKNLLALAAKEGGWNQKGLDHNQPLSNPFGLNRVNSSGEAAGNVDYTKLAGGDPTAGLDLAIQSWEKSFGDRVRGVQGPDDFVYELQHPEKGRPYNSKNPRYEDEYQDRYDDLLKWMKRCGIR